MNSLMDEISLVVHDDPRGAHNRIKTHCFRGHEFTPENTRRYGGSRFCLACQKINNRLKKPLKGRVVKTHCKRGHEFTPENTYVYGKSRACKICRSYSGVPKSASGEWTTYTHGRYRTHCKRGHPMSGENLRVKPSGKRNCRACEEASRLRNPVSKEYACAVQARYRARHPELTPKINAYARERKFRLMGFSTEGFIKMEAEQGGVCAICKQPPKMGKKLAVDHCHEKQIIRGLLCGNCNVAIGHLRDSRDILMSAMAYLEKTQTLK